MDNRLDYRVISLSWLWNHHSRYFKIKCQCILWMIDISCVLVCHRNNWSVSYHFATIHEHTHLKFILWNCARYYTRNNNKICHLMSGLWVKCACTCVMLYCHAIAAYLVFVCFSFCGYRYCSVIVVTFFRFVAQFAAITGLASSCNYLYFLLFCVMLFTRLPLCGEIKWIYRYLHVCIYVGLCIHRRILLYLAIPTEHQTGSLKWFLKWVFVYESAGAAFTDLGESRDQNIQSTRAIWYCINGAGQDHIPITDIDHFPGTVTVSLRRGGR